MRHFPASSSGTPTLSTRQLAKHSEKKGTSMRMTRREAFLFALAAVATACAPAATPSPTTAPAAAPQATRKPIPTLPPEPTTPPTATPNQALEAAAKKAQADAATAKVVAIPTAPQGTVEAGLIYPPCGWSTRSADKIEPALLAFAGDDASQLHARYYVTKESIGDTVSFYRSHLNAKDGWSGDLAPTGAKDSWLGKYTNAQATDVGYIYIYPDAKLAALTSVQILEQNAEPPKKIYSTNELGC